MATIPKSTTVQIFKIPGNNSTPRIYGMVRNGYVEKPPIRPLPAHACSFTMTRVIATSWTGVERWPVDCMDIALWSGPYGGTATATNKAISKFSSKLGESAMLAVNAYERKQAFDSILNRSLQLLGAARALRRGNLKSFFSHLGVSPEELTAARKGRKTRSAITIDRIRKDKSIRKSDKDRLIKEERVKAKSRNAADTWLEYHFGWEPLVRDIYNSIDILQKDLQPVKVVVRSGDSAETTDDFSRTRRWNASWRSRHHVRCQAEVSVSNPNLWRANQLGLINPAAIAWELIPFSFLVDWFLPVGQFLSDYSRFYGLTIKDPQTSVLSRTTYVLGYKATSYTEMHTYEGVHWKRTLSLPSYQLRFKTFKGFSVSRGATAIALLVQQLKR